MVVRERVSKAKQMLRATPIFRENEAYWKGVYACARSILLFVLFVGIVWGVPGWISISASFPSSPWFLVVMPATLAWLYICWLYLFVWPTRDDASSILAAHRGRRGRGDA